MSSSPRNLSSQQASKAKAELAARELINSETRQALEEPELSELFSLKWRKKIIAGLAPPIREKLMRMRSTPSAIVVGLHFLTSLDLSLGQVVKIMTVKPGTSELVEGNFIVTGAYKTGSFDLDSRVIFVSNRRLSTFLRTHDSFTGNPCFEKLRIALDKPEFADQTRELVKLKLGSLPVETGAPNAIVQTWEEQKAIFLKAVSIEKWIMGFVVSLLNIFTGCIILLMLVLLVIEKTRDAGILLSMGATPMGVFSIFLINGLLITLMGTAAGLLLGFLFTQNINTLHDWIYLWTGYQLFDPEVYLMDRIPIHLKISDVLFSLLPALIFGFLASLIPAFWASRKDPIQAIHYE